MEYRLLHIACSRAFLLPTTLLLTFLTHLLHAQTTGWNQTAGGTYDYHLTGNWVDGAVNGLWDASLTLEGTQNVTFGMDAMLADGLTFNYAGGFNTTLRSAGGEDRTLTLGGDITVNTASTTRTITIGSTSSNLGLNIDLGGETRTFTVGSGRTLGFVNVISNGGIIARGGSLNFSGANTYAGATTIYSGAFNLNGASGSAASSDFTINANSGATTTLTFNSNTSGVAGATRAKSVTLHGPGAGGSGNTVLSVVGNSGADSVDSITNALTTAAGTSIVSVSANANRNARLAAGSFVREAGSVVLFRGTNLGANTIASQTAGSSNISFTSAPVLSGAGAAGTSTTGIIKGAYGADVTNTTTGQGFVTYDSTYGVRLLDNSEYTDGISDGQSQLDNVRYARSSGSVSQDTHLTAANTTINSLSFNITGSGTNSGVTLSGDPGATLTISSGSIFASQQVSSVNATDAMIIAVPTLDLNGQEGVITVFTNGISNGNTTAPLNISSVITNDGGNGVTFGGTGQTVLSGSEANTYTGITTLNNGVLRLNKSVANIGLTTDLVMNGGTLLKNSNAIADSASVTINGGTFWMDSTSSSGNNGHQETLNNFTMNGGGFGNHGSNAVFNINGNATLTASQLGMNQGGDITVLGVTTLDGGHLLARESSSDSVRNAFTTLNDLDILQQVSGAYTAMTLNGHATRQGALVTLNGDVTFTGNSTNTNTVKIAVSDPELANQGVIALNGTRTFDIDDGAAEDDLTVEAALVDDEDTEGGLIKTGAGTLVLTSASTYTGPTTINAGRLLANNSNGSATGVGSVTVATGATLGGGGRVATAAGQQVLINGTLQVGTGSASAPAAATFELASESISFGASSVLAFDLISGSGDGLDNNIAGTDADYLVFDEGTASVDISSGAAIHVQVSDTMTDWMIDDTWRLIDWTLVSAVAGEFTFSSNVDNALFDLGLMWDISQLHTQGIISIAAIPEPSRALLLFAALGTLLTRRRRRAA